MLDLQQYISLVLLVQILVITPGPANLVMMSAGARFGFTASLRFFWGILIGNALLIAALAFGFYSFFEETPLAFTIVSFISAAYMTWLSVNIAFKPFATQAQQIDKPPGIIAGMMVHPLNPKAWAIITLVLADFGPFLDTALARFLVFGIVLTICQSVAHLLWAFAGDRLIKVITNGRWQGLIQKSLGLLTITVVLWIMVQ